MRFIPTTTASVESLKKQAKKLQRQAGGTHTGALDRVARGAGYNHWHHVTVCLKQSSAVSSFDALQAECDLIIKAARKGVATFVMTGPEVLTTPLILFAWEGDAWMLEPKENQALCLMFHGEPQPYEINDLPTQIEIVWDGTFELVPPFFKVQTDNPKIGNRVIAGLPLDDLRQLIDKAQSIKRRIESVIAPADGIPLTEENMSELIRIGNSALSSTTTGE